MSLHQLYNLRRKYCNFAFWTVYSTFLLCLQFCFPFLLSEARFCRLSLNFASLVFYFSEKVVVNDCIQLSILIKQNEKLFQLSIIAVFISLFIYVRARLSEKSLGASWPLSFHFWSPGQVFLVAKNYFQEKIEYNMLKVSK